MSFDFNYKFWVATRKDIKDIIKRQNVLKTIEPVQEKAKSFKIFSELYVLHVELVNKLAYVYNNTFQIQKRKVIRPLVESALRHLTELKNELKGLELSEYVYVDKTLKKMKLIPYDLVIWRSPQFLFKRPPEMQNIIHDNLIFRREEQKDEQLAKELLCLKKAIILIQAHERARKARAYLAAIKYDKNLFKRHKRNKVKYSFTYKPDQSMSIPVKRTYFGANFLKPTEYCKSYFEAKPLERNSADELVTLEQEKFRVKAARKIQRMWRSYKNRKEENKELTYNQTLYNMRRKRRFAKPNAYNDSILDAYKKEIHKKKLDDEFIKLINDERVRLLQQRGPWIMEDISDHIRAWFREFYEKCANFHPYPEAIKSGTILVVIGESWKPIEFDDKLKEANLSKEEKKKRAEKAKQVSKKEKEMLKKEKLKKSKKKAKNKAAGIIDIADQMKSNKNIQNIEETIKQYSIDWRLIDEYLNKNHEPIKEWVTEGELATIHRELREIVDTLMRIEYEFLRKAYCADLKKKYKPPKEKKERPKKGNKMKIIKDLTEDRTIETLYEELKEVGIIEKCSTKSFDEFIADFNFLSDYKRNVDTNLTLIDSPAKGDIKMVIQDAMVGMGEFTVDKPKSLLLIGPIRSGKKLLCNIIASELDAVFMNLSPEKTTQFSDRLPYLINIVMKVAKAYQPAILYMQDVHRVFWKRVPKEQVELNPRLLNSVLLKKILKPIRKEDKIMLIGTSDCPWTASPRIKRVFDKIILIPKSDYGTSFLIWLEKLEKYLGNENLEDYAISALAKVMQDYTSGDITENMATVLSIKRKMHTRAKPIDPREFLEQFYKDEGQPVFPPDVKVLDRFQKWFNSTNKLAKARIKVMNEKVKEKDPKKN